MREKRDFVPAIVLIAIFALILLAVPHFADADERTPVGGKKYSVEAFSDELTIRIECAGVCDLAEMKTEAREAVGK